MMSAISDRLAHCQGADVVAIRLREPIKAKLDEICRIEGWNRSKAIRAAIAFYHETLMDEQNMTDEEPYRIVADVVE